MLELSLRHNRVANSVAQALSNCPPLSLYFVRGWQGAHPSLTQHLHEDSQDRHRFVNCLAEVVRALWLTNRRDFEARDLTRSIIRAVPEFRELGQHLEHPIFLRELHVARVFQQPEELLLELL